MKIAKKGEMDRLYLAAWNFGAFRLTPEAPLLSFPEHGPDF